MLRSRKDSTFSEIIQGLPLLGRLAGIRPGNYRAVIAQPKSEGDEFEVLGSGRSYEQLVSLENSGEIFQQRVLYSVQALMLEALEFGARELFIGHPREHRYEFFVGDTGYQGAIEPADYFALLRLFGKESDLEFQVDHFEIEAMMLSLTSNHSNPVVHVGWRNRWVDAEATTQRLAQ